MSKAANRLAELHLATHKPSAQAEEGIRPSAPPLARRAHSARACTIITALLLSHAALARQAVVARPATVISQPATTAQPAAQPAATPAPAAAVPVVGAAVPPDPAAGFTPQEIDRLRKTYDSLEEPDRADMITTYSDMGIDLEVLLGLKAPPGIEPIARPLPDALRALDFSRKPEAVLAARSQLGFTGSVMPDRSNGEALAKWLHMNVLAGEWSALDVVLSQSTPADATAIYSHILRSTNAGVQGLLPEEVLALGDACPGEMVDWQVDVLSQMLNASASRYGKGLFLAKLKEGTKLFGGKDEASRTRTVRLLVGGGLALEAFEFLPPLDEARTNADARVIFAHARYHQDLADSGLAGEQAEEHVKQGWALLGEVALIPTADVTLRKDAMKRAIDLLPSVPPAQAKEWLSKIFANEAMGPAALEVVAMQAITFRDKKIDAAKRAQGIATMKSAVDTLLAQPDLNLDTLRVPLRMLTTALADEVDAVVKEKGELRGVARETDLLFRASPDKRWLGAIEPSVAIRGYTAAIAIATIADETDVALDVLSSAVKRFPEQGAEFADGFLQLWEKRLNPKNAPNEYENYFYFYQQQRVPAAPLTRGRQHRNLDKLERLLKILADMGVGAPKLPSVTAAFKACHARTEVFDRAEITRVFGPVDKLTADTASALADHMRTGLGGDWRNRQVQRTYGMSRSTAEISELVEVGYELAIELAARAVEAEPDSWRHAVLRAALSYDRVQFKQTQQKDDFTKYNEYRRQAFAAFEQASSQYASLVSRGEEHDSAGVYLRWFTAVLDAGQPTPTDKDAADAEAATNDDQIKRIADAMKTLPPDAYERHIAAFARDVAEALSGLPPERKPSIVRSAVKIVGDHPAGAPLRRLAELYEDLLKNEIRLRITVDGNDRVSNAQLFGISLTLRFTNSVDRETGGFDKYLYQDAFVRIGNQYKSMNYQGQIKKSIETALGQSFSVESIGFFEPMTPSRAVKEDGQMGWQEKPIAYILVKAKDPSVDRIPQISFDMHFEDSSGPVTLPIVSNAPPIDAAASDAPARPLKKLQVQQVIDVRRLVNNRDDRAVMVEISAKGDGVIPDLNQLFEGLDNALPGYKIADDGVESRPYSVVQSEESKSQRFWGFNSNPDEEKKYVTADENGIFRLATERSWLVTYKPTGSAVAKEFTLPKLKNGVEGELQSRSYADMDIVKVDGATVAVVPRWSITAKLAGILGLLVLVAAGMWFYFRRRKPELLAAGGFALPARITPLSTIATLERLMKGQNGKLDAGKREAITSDIASIQKAYFAPTDPASRPDENAMRSLLEKWARSLH